MLGVPIDVGDAIDKSLCKYTGYFPKVDCILCTCNKCGTTHYQNSILRINWNKLKDERKRFLVKIWVTKTECKEGAVQSFLHWKFERCNYTGLIALLMEHMSKMAEHTFMASWNYVQYKQARKNILGGDVIFVHDFTQNYLCTHQNEVQDLHWRHKQVTLMPTVAHYRCAKCNEIVMHEILHITDDMKHDAHLVNMFTERSIEVLKSNNVQVHKIIKFTDQAPSQYKNKTAFTYLVKCSIPIQKNYFGVRHGKSSCDACTGRVKQAVTNIVKSEQAVVNSAQSFYSTCVEHLQKPMEASDKCQHYMLTVELHEKICKRPNTKNWQGIPDTRKLHQIGNTGGNVLYFCKFTCCCFGCLQGTIPCQNTICPSEWEAFDLQKKKTVDANLKHWFGGEITNAQMHNIYNAQIHNIDWNAILQRLSEQRSFVQVKRYVNGNPIPDLIICEPNDNLMPQETLNLDLVAMHYMPSDMPAGLAPINIEGDGNCFPRTISYLLSKLQQLYTEMRVHIIYEAVRNMDKYLDHNYVSVGAHNFYQ